MTLFTLLFILSTVGSLTAVPSARQSRPGIRLVKTNQYRNPIRRQISTGYGAPSVSASSGYGSPVSAPNGYGSPVADVVDVKSAPSCTTVYEDECSEVQDEECETVQDRRCSVSFSKTCSPNKEKKCDQVVDTINEQTCTSQSQRKCATVSHPACHVMKE